MSASGLPLRDVGVPCDHCGCEDRRPDTNRCAACGRFAPDPIYAYSELSGEWYRVTEWDNLGDGKIVAKSKESVPKVAVPDAWVESIEGTLGNEL